LRLAGIYGADLAARLIPRKFRNLRFRKFDRVTPHRGSAGA
jgi:hypothetical protein